MIPRKFRFPIGMLLLGFLLLGLGVWVSPFRSSNFQALQGAFALDWRNDLINGARTVGGIPVIQNQEITITVDTTRRTLSIQYVFTGYIPGDYWFQVIVPFTLTNQSLPFGEATWMFLDDYPYGGVIRIHYVIAAYNWTNPSFVTPLLTDSFDINQSFTYDDRGTYTVALPFGQAIPVDIARIAEYWVPGMGVTGGGTPMNNIEVGIPANSVLVQAIPGTPAFQRSGDLRVNFLTWRFSNQLPMVVVSFTMPSEADQYANNSLLFGLFVGSGVGIAADAFYRCYDAGLFGWVRTRIKRLAF